MYQLLSVNKLATSSYHPNCNGGVERVNQTMAQMLAMVVNERQGDWDLHLPHVELSYNDSVSAATGLAPNEVHMGRLPRLPRAVFDRTGVLGHQSLARDHLAYYDLATDRQKRANDIVRAHHALTVSVLGRLPRLPRAVFDRTGVLGHQSLARDHLAYYDLATDRQKRANDIVRAHHALTISRVNRRNSTLVDALRPAPNFAVGGWAWVYSSASTIRQGVKANTDAKVLKAKLALNWTGPYKVLAVGPCSATETPDGSPLESNLLYLDLPYDLLGSDARRRVAIERCKPCANPHDSGPGHAQIPTGGADAVRAQQFFQEVPTVPRHSRRHFDSPPTAGSGADHWPSVGTGARWRYCGAIQDALGGTLRTVLGAGNGPPPLPLPHLPLLGRNPGPTPPNQPPLPPNADRGGTARGLALGYACVSRADGLRCYHDAVLPKQAHFWYKGDDGLWWLGKISASITEGKVYLVRFLDDPGPIKLPLPPARYTTSTRAVRNSWCLQVHIASAFHRGIQRDVDESRGTSVAS